ncbi:hypothetical protein [uncultured Dysosmobacter sp.]|uniref:hypothetical protein n=1 Tax=uncultured Dysosmobacter sp. TaxID=2591384 RepID=UPI002614DB11|nr:hypothetical protein [uncultured Dysosmobacter sp.]
MKRRLLHHHQQCLPEFPGAMERALSVLRILPVTVDLGSFYTMGCRNWFRI